MKIIGMELRLEVAHNQFGMHIKEIGIVPCDIDVEVDANATSFATFSGTMHTDIGDLNFNFNHADFRHRMRPIGVVHRSKHNL